MIDTLELKRCSFFESFSEAELTPLASLAARVQYKEGEVLFHARSPATYLYILRKGTVLLCYPNGRSLPLRNGGQAIGWSSLVSPFQHTATAICLTDVDLYECSADELYRVIQMNANLGQLLMRKVAKIMEERGPYFNNTV
jgi:CRP-like cAMP-binding protein